MSASLDRTSRQSAILEVLRSSSVQTQAQLASELRRRRINATQATISRDLRQLRVARVPAPEGLRYLPPTQDADSEARLAAALASQLKSLEVVGPFVVLRTLPGAAPIVASAVDGLALEDVAGSVAGDDTVFVLTRTNSGAKAVGRYLQAAQARGATWS
ncbi:MAG TPA: arginine repressor [Candidatus Dormibacteraeota bacterium]|nr:arginine repressor [Candidatus Dormibacteraeota bacterium]